MPEDKVETHPTFVWAEDEAYLRRFGETTGEPGGQKYIALADRIRYDSDIGKDEAPVDCMDLTQAQEALLIQARSEAKGDSFFMRTVKALVKKLS
ncbi:MAG TPA: hypothetical protein VD947_00535 [Patescibacteria group bacterium]|nr:hypothetical protein [Patescibacteria group bacterium]